MMYIETGEWAAGAAAGGVAPRPLRVMIDGYNLAMPRGTGVATYAFTLAHTLRAMGADVDGLYGLRAGLRRDLRETRFFESLASEHRTKVTKLSWRQPWDIAAGALGARARRIETSDWVIKDAFSSRLPEFDRLMNSPDLFDRAWRHFRRTSRFLPVRTAQPPDIMHWTYPLPLRMVGARNIYTMHDLVPLRLPYASLDNKQHYHRLMKACARHADHICTVSESSRDDILKLLKIDPSRVTNTYQAIHVRQDQIDEPDAVIADTVKGVFNLPYKGYFLFFGAIEPKKNVGRLIEAYLSLATETPLVIVGARAWLSDQELALLQRDETQPLRATFRRVRRLDYLPRSLLIRLVRGARAVAFPSLYEGFGLPVAEAMRLGVPVLTSRTGSLGEVAGDGAVFVDPYKPGDIARGLRMLDSDADLRARLAARGPEVAARFSVDAYRRRLADMYARVQGERAPIASSCVGGETRIFGDHR